MLVDNKFGWPLPPDFVQKDIIGLGETWTWMDENHVVHGPHVFVTQDGRRYVGGRVACENKSVCDFIHCNMSITCFGCIAAGSDVEL